MKKHLLTGFLALFLLSTTTFAGLVDPKKESGNSSVTNPKENKLSEEELSRMTRRVETDNLTKPDFSVTERNVLKKDLNPRQEIIVTRQHQYGRHAGGSVLVLIVLIILLV